MEANRKLGKILRQILILFIFSQTACSIGKKVVTTIPPPDMLLLMKAKEYIDSGDIKRAEELLNKFVLIFPANRNYPYALYLKAEIAFREGRYFKAYQLYLTVKKMKISEKLLRIINHRLLFLQELLKIKKYTFLPIRRIFPRFPS